MKKILPIVLLSCFMLAAASLAATSRPVRTRAASSSALSRSILGTWELAWPSTSPTRELKLITPSHFTWTHFDPATHRVLATGGGGYTILNGVYCEQLDFAQGDIESAAGRVLCFRLEVHGDTLQQSSVSASDSPQVREIWRRVR